MCNKDQLIKDRIDEIKESISALHNNQNKKVDDVKKISELIDGLIDEVKVSIKKEV